MSEATKRPRWGLNSTGSVVDLETGTRATARQSRHFLSKLKLDPDGTLRTRSGKTVPGTGDHHLEAQRIYRVKARRFAGESKVVVKLTERNDRAEIQKARQAARQAAREAAEAARQARSEAKRQAARDRAREKAYKQKLRALPAKERARRLKRREYDRSYRARKRAAEVATRPVRIEPPTGTMPMEPVSGTDPVDYRNKLAERITEDLLANGATTNQRVTIKVKAAVEYIDGIQTGKGKGKGEPSQVHTRQVERSDAVEALTQVSNVTRPLTADEAKTLGEQLAAGIATATGGAGQGKGYVGSIDGQEGYMELMADQAAERDEAEAWNWEEEDE